MDIQLLLNNLITNHLEFILGVIITIIISFIVYKKSKPRTRLSYYYSNKLILNIDEQNVSEHVSLLINNFELKKLVKTEFRIWNDGSTIIRSEDKINENPLRIVLDEKSKIIAANIIKNTDTDNNFSVRNINNVIYIDFNYLEPKSGILIEILHNNENTQVNVLGKIIGLKGTPENSRYKLNSRLARLGNYFEWFTFFMLIWLLSIVSLIVTVYIANCCNKFHFLPFIGLIIYAFLPTILIQKFKKYIGLSLEYPYNLR